MAEHVRELPASLLQVGPIRICYPRIDIVVPILEHLIKGESIVISLVEPPVWNGPRVSTTLGRVIGFPLLPWGAVDQFNEERSRFRCSISVLRVINRP